MAEQEQPKAITPFPSKDAADHPLPVKVLSKETLVEYQEDQLVKYAPKVTPRIYRSLIRRLDSDEPKAVDQAAQIFGLIKSSPGIVFNLQQNNFGESGNDSEMYFESVIKRLEQRDRPREDDVIDIIEVPPEEDEEEQEQD